MRITWQKTVVSSWQKYIPTDLEGVEVKLTPNERYAANPDETATRPLPLFSSTASKKDGKLHISMSNVKLNEAQSVVVKLDGMKAKKVSGKILTSDKASNYNTFENPDKIKLADFDGARIDKKTGDLILEIPAASIVTLEVE